MSDDQQHNVIIEASEIIENEQPDDVKISEELPNVVAVVKVVETIIPSPGPSKEVYRLKVWDHLEAKDLSNHPRPCHGRIPNFKGAELAAARLLDLAEFRNATSVVVNPDKPLEASRVLVLENRKVLYVPIPRLQEGDLLKKMSFCEEDQPRNVQQIVTRWGIDTLGKNVDLGDDLHVEVFVLGSVAVSREGRRIGKGKGYADLEFAILKDMGAINDDTIIVTTVHESQVFDTLPNDIFDKYDVPLDYILTPTETIKVSERVAEKFPRPEGIYWHLLSQRRVQFTPVLQKLKDIHSGQGKDTALKEVDTDVEGDRDDLEKRVLRPRRFLRRRIPRENREVLPLVDVEKNPQRRRRFFRATKAMKEKVINENEDPIHMDDDKGRKFKRHYSRRLQVNFSLQVGNIDKNVRVRHLKDALIDRGIKPQNITWRGGKGFCYLHYAKPPTKELEEQQSFAVDSIIEILQSLKLNPESDANLSVKVLQPITRIETTNVTAV